MLRTKRSGILLFIRDQKENKTFGFLTSHFIHGINSGWQRPMEMQAGYVDGLNIMYNQ